jgi:hypothetical protein
MTEGFRQQTGEVPTFWLDDDGRHVVWEHDCRIDWMRDGSDVTLLRTEPWPLPINEQTGWVVRSTDPLTVTPSILCTGCGTHGFITDGQWVGC